MQSEMEQTRSIYRLQEAISATHGESGRKIGLRAYCYDGMVLTLSSFGLSHRFRILGYERH